jgi:Zn-finger nucleic acid-binding protein
MIRYRIQPDLDLWIDHCGGCNGMWFDNNEWAYLRHHGLHRHLHFYFTDAWQTRLRQEEKRRQRRRRYEEQFGADTLARLDALRNWLHGHAHADALIAYLAAEDPYA